MSDDKSRDELLIHMYGQMFRDIEKHVITVWHSCALVVGVFLALLLTGQGAMDQDVGAALTLVLVAWSVAHNLDASYWYNRNLVIIGNIERQFLRKSDLKEVHYYFGTHRPRNSMITLLKVQVWLAAGIAVVVVGQQVAQTLSSGPRLLTALPGIVLVVGLVLIARLKRNRDASYREFLGNSPGLRIDTGTIEYGPGHGHRSPPSEAVV